MEKRLTMFFASLFLCVGMAVAQTTVKGTVFSQDDGQPIIGAAVQVEGTKIGLLTNMDGEFTITLPAGKTQLKISYLGMESQVVAAKNGMRVFLKSDANALEEVVVTGYGSGKKIGSLVGSLKVVDNKVMAQSVTPSFTDALAGQVAGLSVLSSSGDPSQAATIRLRGVNSINSSNAPLFILDGAPISATLFSTLNPADIESVTVLKDASSTAIYGSRAANGVIVITSKKGKLNEKANISFRAQYGISTPVEDGLEMMNSQQYVQFRDKIGQPVSDEIRNLVDKYGLSTNWRDELLSNSAPTYTLEATVSGGSNTTNYYISANHHSQDGLIESSGMKREALRINLDTRVTEWLKVGLQSNLGVSSYQTNAEASADDGIYLANPMVAARMAMPFDVPNYYTIDENGNIIWGERAARFHYSGFNLPWWTNDHRDRKRKTVTVNLNTYEQVTPLQGLTIRAQQALYGYDYTYSGVTVPYEAFTTPMGDKISANNGSVSDAFTRYYSFTFTNTAEYKRNIKGHFFSLLLGQESIITKSRSFSVATEGQTDPRLTTLLNGTTIQINDDYIGDSRYEQVFNSYFGALSYNYNEKYFVDLSLRTDGSSKFAPDHRWATFWSVGAMWNAKKESFLSDVKWLTALEPRISYGTTGNSSGAGSYDYYGLFGGGSLYNGSSTMSIASASNYELTWETVKALNVGLSLGLFDRVMLNVDYYSKKTVDMLMDIPYSYTTGFGSGDGNIGSMTNKGVDIDIDVNIMKTKDFRWDFKANFNYNKNEITELFAGRDEYIIANTGLKLQVGKPYGEFYVVRYAGVDSRDGKPMWYDKDGNLTKVYNEERDAVFVGKQRYAPYSGGFGTSATWKGLMVSVDFAWQAKKYMTNNDNYFTKNANMGTSYNQTTDMLNVWTKPGDVTDIPAYGEEIQFDSHLLENASFLRLKNVTIQYTLPKKWMDYTRVLKGARIYAIGRNLLTFTKFSGYDPEPDINLVKFNYPNTRQFVIGAELTF